MYRGLLYAVVDTCCIQGGYCLSMCIIAFVYLTHAYIIHKNAI